MFLAFILETCSGPVSYTHLINIQLSLQGFYNEIQKAAEEKMNTITLQDIIDTYYQRISIENNLQNII